MDKQLIVSRHPATIEFIRTAATETRGTACAACGGTGHTELEQPDANCGPGCCAYCHGRGVVGDAPVVAQADADDVRDAIVYGNLPLHLAALAAEVWAVEFSGEPPRGAEYDLAEMRAAGARLARYRVAAVADQR